jgi:hypothetical protein
MRTIIVSIVSLALAGCATPTPVKEYIDRPVEVRVPVSKPCLKVEDIPKPISFMLDNIDATNKYAVTNTIIAAKIDLAESKRYVKDTQALLTACSK